MDESVIEYISLLKAREEIAALGLRYATATDTVGRGDVDEGRRIYRTCFIQDAVIESLLPDRKPDDPPLSP